LTSSSWCWGCSAHSSPSMVPSAFPSRSGLHMVLVARVGMRRARASRRSRRAALACTPISRSTVDSSLGLSHQLCCRHPTAGSPTTQLAGPRLTVRVGLRVQAVEVTCLLAPACLLRSTLPVWSQLPVVLSICPLHVLMPVRGAAVLKLRLVCRPTSEDAWLSDSLRVRAPRRVACVPPRKPSKPQSTSRCVHTPSEPPRRNSMLAVFCTRRSRE
jgi:hypothetical protein